MITKIEAVRSLFGHDSYDVCRADGYVKWKDGHTTTAEETAQINAEVIKLQAEHDSKEYARKRKAKYDLLNQDEMRFDDLINSTTTWKDAILAIKSEFPKP
jgi:hypothetical protein